MQYFTRSLLVDIVDAAGLQEARYPPGLNLHMHSVQAGSKGPRVHADCVLLPFLDRIDKPLSHRWQLTFTTNRDAASFADHLMESVELFMDEMLDAFDSISPSASKQKAAVIITDPTRSSSPPQR
jgi:hypothetical protein